MNESTQNLLFDLAEFCTESMRWCAQESEVATMRINEVLGYLVEEGTRISAISKETLDAVQSMREIVNNLAKERNREVANELAEALTQTSLQNEQVREFVAPIIEALQFQDRLTQNMQNFGKMIRTWLEKRIEIWEHTDLAEADLVDFGERLLKCTTMHDEREMVRKFIPGLKQEENAAKTVLFF